VRDWSRLACLLLGLLWLSPSLESAQADTPVAISDLPVSFQVKNTNTSRVPCLSDGASYTVRGHLTGPSAALGGAGPKAVSLYLHDLGDGEWYYRFAAVPGYDFAAEMARQGDISLTIADLGYLPSGQPNGNLSCTGAHADVVHQIVQQLREGSYSVRGARPVRFRKVALAGLSVGAVEAQIEAYSYKDIDGLIVTGYSDKGASSVVYQNALLNATPVCARGGDRAQGDSGPSGYFYFDISEQQYEENVFNADNADPAVMAAAGSLRTRAPCGDLSSAGEASPIDQAELGEVTVPVLLVYGGADKLYPASGEPGQRAEFSGSRDASSAIIPNGGHLFTLERTAPEFRAILARWLRSHGLAASVPTHRRRRPRVRISSRRVRLTRHGVARVRVACVGPRGSTCRGRLRLVTVARGRRVNEPKGVRRRLGTRAFSIRAGHSRVVRVRLGRRAFRLVRRKRHLRVRAVALARTRAGTRSLGSSVFTLLAPRRRRGAR
jgi:pimeloyl-ACP methyl ester carboxylesterase